jgi:hypothetical protein
MKQIVVTFLLLVAQLAVAAPAAECEFDKVEVDSFTNERTVHTQKRMLTNRVDGFVGRVWGGKASEVLIRGISEGENQYIAIEVRLLKTFSTPPDDEDLREALSVKKGARLMVLMDDDSIVKLDADRAFNGKAGYDVDVDGDYGVDARITVLYRLDEESTHALISGEATVIRVAIDSGRLALSGRDASVNFGTNSKSRHFFEEAILCLQQGPSAEAI